MDTLIVVSKEILNIEKHSGIFCFVTIILATNETMSVQSF